MPHHDLRRGRHRRARAPWSRPLALGSATVVAVAAGALTASTTVATPRASFAAATLVAPGTSTTGTPVPATKARGLNLGVQSNVSWRDYDKLVQELDLMQQAGVHWTRINVSWASLQEHDSGHYSQWYLDRLDRITAEASKRHIQILGTLIGSPSWMPVKSFTRDGLPTDPSALQAPARLLAQRYAGKITAWQIWNEPDCDQSACSTVDPHEYVPLLKAGYAGVKAGDSNATVVTAGFSGIDAAWIQRLYDAGARGSFDALAVHPYLAPANGSPRLQPVGTNPYRITNTPAAVAVMARNGDGGKPIWFTEFGWTTGRQSGAYDGVTDTTQAYFLRDAALLVQDNYPQVTHMFWYMMRDRDDSNVYENNFGLLHTDGSPKAAYWSLKESEGFLG